MNLTRLDSDLGYDKKDAERLCDYAIYPEAIAAFRALLDKGVPAASVDEFGISAVQRACQGGNLEAVKLLVERGAKPGEVRRSSGMSGFHWAAENGHAAVVSYLLSIGLDVNLQDPRGGPSPLHCACGVGAIETVQVLLDAGADVDAKNGFGDKPFELNTDEARTVRQWYLAREAQKVIFDGALESSGDAQPERRSSKFSL